MATSQHASSTLHGLHLLDDILCGVDGTRSAYVAVRQAAQLAAPDGRLTLLAATGLGGGSGHQLGAALAPARAQRALTHARVIARREGVEAIVEADGTGPVADVLLEHAAEHALLAVGPPSMSRLAHLILGGTATVAAHMLPASLLVARRPPARGRFAERIIVASDAMAHSDSLVDFATALAAARGASLVVLHAAGAERAHQPVRIEGQARRVRDALGDRATVRVEAGHPYATITAVADVERPSLLIVGSRRIGGVGALGSVSERLVHEAPCSVLVLRPEDLRRPEDSR